MGISIEFCSISESLRTKLYETRIVSIFIPKWHEEINAIGE